jgi:hypothetical protein
VDSQSITEHEFANQRSDTVKQPCRFFASFHAVRLQTELETGATDTKWQKQKRSWKSKSPTAFATVAASDGVRWTTLRAYMASRVARRIT